MKKVLQIQYDTNGRLTQPYSIVVVANGTELGSRLRGLELHQNTEREKGNITALITWYSLLSDRTSLRT